MKRFVLALLCGFALSTVGCAVTRDWVVSEATKIAELAVNKGLDKIDDKLLNLIDEEVQAQIDSNSDGVWDSDELTDAIKGQFGTLATNLKDELVSDTDKKLDERLKDAMTKGDGLKGLIGLVVLFLLGKLGIKVKDGKLNAKDLLQKIFGKKEEEEVKL